MNGSFYLVNGANICQIRYIFAVFVNHLKPTRLLSEILRYYYPYGHLLVGIYGAFAVFICFLGVRYLFLRLREEAEAESLLAEMRTKRMKFEKSSLLDDLPYLMSEVGTPEKSEVKESVLV